MIMIEKEEVITRDRLYEMIVEAQNGNEDAANKIIEGNDKLVWMVVNKLGSRSPQDREDLYQVGLTGLYIAIQKFDISFGTQFSTYAVGSIKNTISKYLRDKYSPVRLPRSLYEASNKVHKQKLHDKTPEEVNELLGLNSVELAEQALRLKRSKLVRSIEEKTVGGTSEDTETTLSSMLVGDVNNDWFNRLLIEEATKVLSEREKLVITQRYVNGYTQEEVGKMVGVGQMQISKNERKALQKMREFLTKGEDENRVSNT